jgi:hypothetical protein
MASASFAGQFIKKLKLRHLTMRKPSQCGNRVETKRVTAPFPYSIRAIRGNGSVFPWVFGNGNGNGKETDGVFS